MFLIVNDFLGHADGLIELCGLAAPDRKSGQPLPDSPTATFFRPLAAHPSHQFLRDNLPLSYPLKSWDLRRDSKSKAGRPNVLSYRRASAQAARLAEIAEGLTS